MYQSSAQRQTALTFLLVIMDTILREAFDMINITVEQAKLILELIENDIQSSEFGEPDYRNETQLSFYLERAVLNERLLSALNSIKEGF